MAGDVARRASRTSISHRTVSRLDEELESGDHAVEGVEEDEDTAGEQYSTVLWRFYLFISLSLVSMAHDLFWYSGMVPWQPYQQLELRDLAIKGLIYTLLYLFFIPPATSIASLFAYATVISLFSKIFSLTSNIFRHEDVSAVYLQHALSTYCLFQKICAFKLVEWIGSDCV